MAISFPGGSKSNGQKFTHQNKSWTWDGNSWKGGVSSGSDAGTLDNLNSTQFLRSDATGGTTGSLGVGTTSPAEKLEVNGSVKVGNLKIQNEYGGRIGFNRNTANGAIYDSSYAAFQINGATSTLDYLSFEAYPVSGSPSNAMAIKSNGNVGIGTSSPGKKLDVNGEARITTGLTITPATSSAYGTDSTLSSYATSNGVYLNGHSSGWLRLNGDGSNRASIDIYGASYTNYNDEIHFKTGNVGSRLVISNDGNVGIGDTNPLYKLSVNNGTSDGGIFRLYNEEVGLNVAIDGTTGSPNYTNAPRTVTLNATRMDTGTSPKLRLGGQGGVEIAADANNVRMVINTAGKVGIGTLSPFSKLQAGGHTFSGGNGMYTDGRVGISNHGNLTGMMLASTYNDSAHPEYGLVFVQGPSTSSYNVWSISPDGPAKGDSLSFHYQSGSTNIHSPGNAKVVFDGNGNVEIKSGQLILANLTSNPSSPVTGGMYFNTTDNAVNAYDGTDWIEVGIGPLGTQRNPAASAAAIKADSGGGAPSGMYWITVSGVNGGSPIEVYCDFTMDGGIGYAIFWQQYFTGYENGPTQTEMNAASISGTSGYSNEFRLSPAEFVNNYNGGASRLAMYAHTGGGSSNSGITGANNARWVRFSSPSNGTLKTWACDNFSSATNTANFLTWNGNSGTAYHSSGHSNGGGVNQISSAATVNANLLFECKWDPSGSDPNHYYMIDGGQSSDPYFRINAEYGNSNNNNGTLYNRWGGFGVH